MSNPRGYAPPDHQNNEATRPRGSEATSMSEPLELIFLWNSEAHFSSIIFKHPEAVFKQFGAAAALSTNFKLPKIMF